MHKLHYKTEFQGLPISVENRKGSNRYWYDPNSDTKGSTKMKYPYGYIRGTLGIDGDAVDVFIGKDKESDKVFIVTQNKAPSFKAIDEQKILLGFSSIEAAKVAYLAHYDNTKFFRNIKEMSLDDFKQKLKTHKGALIKGRLYLDSYFVKIGSNMTIDKSAIDEEELDLNKRFASDAQRKYMYAAADRGEISDKVVKEFQDKTPKGADLPEHVKSKKKDKVEKSMTATESMHALNKALSSRLASSIANRARMQDRVDNFTAPVAAPLITIPVDDGVTSHVGIAEAQPLIGTAREFDLNEPPVVPVRAIHNVVENHTTEPEIYKSCNGCRRVIIETAECPTCVVNTETEAPLYWRR